MQFAEPIKEILCFMKHDDTHSITFSILCEGKVAKVKESVYSGDWSDIDQSVIDNLTARAIKAAKKHPKLKPYSN